MPGPDFFAKLQSIIFETGSVLAITFWVCRACVAEGKKLFRQFYRTKRPGARRPSKKGRMGS